MSNEAKMTLEEKLVQKIKSDTLMALVGDEDAILELTKRAINEALYQPRRLVKSYGGYDEKDSPVVEAARDIAKQASADVASELIGNLTKNDEFRKAVASAIADMLPGAIVDLLDNTITDIARRQSHEAVLRFETTLRDNREVFFGS